MAPVWIGAAVLGTGYGAGWLQPQTIRAAAERGTRAYFSKCITGAGYNCVVDGDTIWLAGEKIRLADIDAPETHDPRCSSEKALGDRATIRLQQLTLQSIDRDRDRYGRLLRLVIVNGQSVGDTLVNEGLARWYDRGRKPWC